MINSDPRTIDFLSLPYTSSLISEYFQINVENFSNEELISVGGVISAIMYIENLGTIEEYTEETIVILNNMIQNKMSEDKDVLYDKVLPQAKLSIKCENAPHIKVFQMRNFCYWKLCKHNFPMQKFLS